MTTTRLDRNHNPSLRDIASIKQYCDRHDIPYSEDFFERCLPTEKERQFFNTYKLNPLPETGLKAHGSSSVLVFENKYPDNNHGDVVASVAQKVGDSLQPGVQTLHVHANLNSNYRANVAKEKVESIKLLAENQGIPVLHTSIGWNDVLLDFDKGHEDQANHLWRVTAFVVDSAGNDGKYGHDGKTTPFQKHNALTHFPPLSVRVGAAAMDDGQWKIEGYSSANSPTFLAPVASKTMVQWQKDKPLAPMTGTSASAPYISGMLAALNQRYGEYLTREQILYALMATCTPIKQVSAFEKKTPKAHEVIYTKNAAGLLYNPEYAGFGLVHVSKADKLLSQMVAMTQKAPEKITIPAEDRVTILNGADVKADSAGLYRYTVEMPPGIALKTTVESDFKAEHGSISISSPAGTSHVMVMSKMDSKDHHFGMATSHGWLGEKLAGTWTISSTTPIKRLRLSQHHFLEKDIVAELDIAHLLQQPMPDLSHARTLGQLNHHAPRRVLHMETVPPEAAPRDLRIGSDQEKPVLGDVGGIIAQLKKLPSGFAQRSRQAEFPPLFIDMNTQGGRLESEAIGILNQLTTHTGDGDILRHEAIEKQLQAAHAYEADGKKLEQIVPLCNAGYNYLNCNNLHAPDGEMNPEKAIPCYTKALRICEKNKLHHKAYEISCNLYTAMCRCCENGKVGDYEKKLRGVREKTLELSRLQQGGVDKKAHRIEEGEYGFSNLERIGTDNVSQCIAIIAHDPLTLKTGLAHVDNENDLRSLDAFFAKFGEDRLQIRLVGARFDQDFRTNENISNVMQYLAGVNADIISSDIYGGNDGPSAVVVDPVTFRLEEKVPGRKNQNEGPSNAIILQTRKGKPLIEQFDHSTGRHERAAVHLNARMLAEFRQQYFGKKEWEIEGYLNTQAVYDRPLLIEHVRGMEDAYNKQWKQLSGALESVISTQTVQPGAAQQAREALQKQSLYVGEHAEAANAPIMHWIKNELIKDGQLQRTALEGPMASHNVYDPPGLPPLGGFIGQVIQQQAAQSGAIKHV